MLNRVLLVQPQLVLPEAPKLMRFDPDRMVRLRRGHSLHRQIRKGKSGRVVEAKHRPGSCSSSLFNVPKHIEARSTDVALAREEKTGNVFGVPMEVDNDGLVCSKEGCEGFLGEGMGMSPDFAEDKEVVDVDNPDAEAFLSQDGRGSDHLEGDLDTATHEHNIGVDPVVGRVAGPDRGACDAMPLGLVHREPSHGRVLGADNQADVYC